MSDLFSSRRRKLPPAEKIPSPKENKLHSAVVSLLTKYGRRDWIWFYPPNEDTRGKTRGRGILSGVADFVLIAPGGRTHMLELKRAGGVVSDAQIAFRDRCMESGVPHAVVFDDHGARDVLASWGALRIKIVGGVPSLGGENG